MRAQPAHWRHLVNTVELVLLSAYPNPQPKRQIDWFIHFCTAHSIVSSGMSEHVLFPSHGGYGLHLIHTSLGPSKSITQTASPSVQPFLHGSRQTLPILYNGLPFTSKIAVPIGDLDPSNTRFLGPSKPKTQTRSQSV